MELLHYQGLSRGALLWTRPGCAACIMHHALWHASFHLDVLGRVSVQERGSALTVLTVWVAYPAPPSCSALKLRHQARPLKLRPHAPPSSSPSQARALECSVSNCHLSSHGLLFEFARAKDHPHISADPLCRRPPPKAAPQGRTCGSPSATPPLPWFFVGHTVLISAL